MFKCLIHSEILHATFEKGSHQDRLKDRVNMMTTMVEKRSADRHYEESSIMYSRFSDHPYSYYGAKMLNYSKNGIYFESKYSIDPGTKISVRKAYYAPCDLCYRFEKPDAMVVVRSEKINAVHSDVYSVGAAHFDPAAGKTEPDLNGLPGIQTSQIENFIPSPGISIGMDIREDTEFTLEEAKNIAELRARELQILHRFALAIGSTLDLQEILQIVCKEMVHIFGARNTGIGLLNREKTRLKLVAFYSENKDETDAAGLELPLEGNASTVYVVNTGQPIVVPDAQNNPLAASLHDIARKRGTHCWMIVPLMARGEVVGTIGMPTSDTKRIFKAEEVALAQTIANQVVGAIDNARLFSETEKARQQAEQDLEIGRKIQTDFFPEKIPEFPGWEISAHFKAARQVTGDFYDIIPLGNGEKVAVVIADVCDHGVGSALFMVLFRSLIRAFIRQNFSTEISTQDDPDRQLDTCLTNTIGETNNYIVHTHERSGMFATVFLGILDPKTGLLKYINGGHEAPMIIDRNGGKTRLEKSGPAVGMYPD
ncbi:MAG: SpoIIE family protein phosphatase, partial [Deltaproteobacteria bacterium]|nr:SpoIIE family protein phosphatase [Deltaproteobacteria bacterium]